MLSSILGGGKGIDIYVSVSPINGLELMVFDPGSMIIKEYAKEDLMYNDASREISSYTDLQRALETAFNRKGINPAKANLHFNLPIVWFAQKTEVPLILSEENVTSLVVDELLQTYVFKNKEPMANWFDNTVVTSSDSRNIFYSAIQKEAIQELSEVASRMGARVASVGCSVIANLRGLKATGLAANQMMADDSSWNFMIINNTGYQLIGMQGSRMADYFEEAMPLKSFEGDEVYTEIENALQIALMSTSASSLIILSETDLVSAEVLASRLQFSGETIAIENNQFKNDQLPGVNLENLLPDEKLQLSLQALGTVAPSDFLPMNINYLDQMAVDTLAQEITIDIPLGEGKIYKLTPQVATVGSAAIAGVVLGLLFFANTYFTSENDNMQAALESKRQEKEQIEAEKAQYSSTETSFDAVVEIEKVLKSNRFKVMSYAALGESVPKNLYLTYFMAGNENLINIKGAASAVEDVYVFFRNLKDSLASSSNAQLRISKLDLKTSSIDDLLSSGASSLDNSQYVFEITNMSESELSTFMDYLTGKSSNKDGDDKDKDKDKNENNGSENGEK